MICTGDSSDWLAATANQPKSPRGSGVVKCVGVGLDQDEKKRSKSTIHDKKRRVCASFCFQLCLLFFHHTRPHRDLAPDDDVFFQTVEVVYPATDG